MPIPGGEITTSQIWTAQPTEKVDDQEMAEDVAAFDATIAEEQSEESN